MVTVKTAERVVICQRDKIINEFMTPKLVHLVGGITPQIHVKRCIKITHFELVF
jgi:hypothetical protein